MVRWFAPFFSAIAVYAQAGDLEDIKQGIERLQKAPSYHYRKTVRLGSGADDVRGGEFVEPDLITLRQALIEVAKKGTIAMARTDKGWVEAKDHPDAAVRDAATRLEAPHLRLKDISGGFEEIHKGEPRDLGDVACNVYTARLSPDAIKAYLAPTLNPAFAKTVDWDNASATAEILISKDAGVCHGVRASIKVEGNAMASKEKDLVIIVGLEFFDHGKVTANLPDEVKKKLGLK